MNIFLGFAVVYVYLNPEKAFSNSELSGRPEILTESQSIFVQNRVNNLRLFTIIS